MKREILKINNNCWTNWIKIINLNLITVHKAKITKIKTINMKIKHNRKVLIINKTVQKVLKNNKIIRK